MKKVLIVNSLIVVIIGAFIFIIIYHERGKPEAPIKVNPIGLESVLEIP